MTSFILPILIVLGVFWLRRNYAFLKGKAGERQVSNTLQKLNPRYYTILNDIYIRIDKGKTSQIDHLVISPKGIFVIETKNYTGWILGNEQNQQWTQVIYKNKEKFYNPIWQNFGHIKAVKDFLGVSDIPFYSIIVFNNQATLKFKEPFKKAIVINRHDLNSAIQKTTITTFIPSYELNNIRKKLSTLVHSNKKEHKKMAKQHTIQVKNELLLKKQKVKKGECPRCGNQLVIRQGKHGSFKGCSNYPKCRYTT